ncbi:MAG: hypothetical protein R2991_15865 [Thermoanaerobaculia bacterium]
MRFEVTLSFERDYAKLKDREKALFREAARRFNAVCDAALAHGGRPRWPKALRVKDVEGAPGVWEMTWSFSGPDGRATWEWTSTEVDGAHVPVIRWRRIGGHAIFGDP